MFMFFMTATSFFCYLLDVNPMTSPASNWARSSRSTSWAEKDMRARQNLLPKWTSWVLELK
jgi:hypothetical protein